MTHSRRERERLDAAKRAAEQLQADLARYRQAKAYFDDLEQRAVRFAPLNPTAARWRGLRD
jgi:hypothetical protein